MRRWDCRTAIEPGGQAQQHVIQRKTHSHSSSSQGFSSAGAPGLSLIIDDSLPVPLPAAAPFLLEFISYRLSIALYIHAPHELSAVKTRVNFTIAPFINTALSFLIFLELPIFRFIAALKAMVLLSMVVSRKALMVQC